MPAPKPSIDDVEALCAEARRMIESMINGNMTHVIDQELAVGRHGGPVARKVALVAMIAATLRDDNDTCADFIRRLLARAIY
jgi:hypothetical protein